MHEKIKSIDSLSSLVQEKRALNLRIVLCHGVFDLLHFGHVRHLKEAKELGDILIVSLTPDHFVNKGPNRPFFTEAHRLEQLAALECVDFAVLNDTAEATAMIDRIKPDIYVKGKEYAAHDEDVTGKIKEEVEAIEGVGGFIHYTDDLSFSSSKLLNQLDLESKRLKSFLDNLKSSYSLDVIVKKIEALANLRVLVIGDAIIDQYQYVQTLGQSGKGLHLSAALLDQESFLGGSLIIASHVANFAKKVTLLTSVGKLCPKLSFIESQLPSNVSAEWIFSEKYPTLTKKRYVLKDGEVLTKLFETYSSTGSLINSSQEQEISLFLEKNSSHYDLILVSDFGNGFLSQKIVDKLSELNVFLAVNTQINSGNRGFHAITRYKRADCITLNEPELRLAAHEREAPLIRLAETIMTDRKASQLFVTRGVKGAEVFTKNQAPITIPALTSSSIDRLGAGDSYLALAALSAASQNDSLLSGFLGAVAAAMDVHIVGNRESVNKIAFLKYVTRLMK